uniref:Uncharacterized protein n=1 Tax=Lepeophtheirus salmonis TaxID=72036 RepID=A0A0K2U749_LEPSM
MHFEGDTEYYCYGPLRRIIEIHMQSITSSRGHGYDCTKVVELDQDVDLVHESLHAFMKMIYNDKSI